METPREFITAKLWFLLLYSVDFCYCRSRSVGSLLENGPTAISPDRERPMPTPPVPNESLDVCEDSVTEVLYVPFVEGRCNVPPKPKPRKKKLEEKKPGGEYALQINKP